VPRSAICTSSITRPQHRQGADDTQHATAAACVLPISPIQTPPSQIRLSVRPSAVRHSVGYLVNHLSPSLLSISVSPNYAVPQYRLLSMFIILCWCQQYVFISLQTGTIENGAHYAVNCAFACMLSTNSPTPPLLMQAYQRELQQTYRKSSVYVVRSQWRPTSK